MFLLLIFAFIEFGHVFMTVHVLNGAAKQAGRSGVGDNSTTAKVVTKANQILSKISALSNLTVEVLDGSVFDNPNVDPSQVDYSSLPSIELAEAESRQLFIVRCSLPYNSIAILGPKWVKDLTVYGQSVVRHE